MPRAKSGDSYKKGDKVQAKWAGGNIYYPATIMEIIDSKKCKIEYDDGTVHNVRLSDVKPPSAKKSESASNRVRSRSRSGGRVLRSRSRSPARKSKTVKSEKKPAKPEKKVNSITPERRSPSKKKSPSPTKKEEKEEKSIIRSRLSIGNRSSAETVTYSETVQQKTSVSNKSSQLRSSSRIAALQTARLSTSTPDSDRRKLRKNKANYSDDEESDEDEVDVVSPLPKKISYLSVSVLVIKTMVLPLIPILFVLACSRRQCSVFPLPTVYSKLREFWDDIMIPLSACLTFHLALSLLSKIPIGQEISGFPFGSRGITHKYRINGLFILIFSVLIFGGLTYYKIDMNWGYDRIKSLVISSLLYSLLWSVVLHCRSLIRGVSTEQAKSNQEFGFLGNFFYGHEINPTLTFDGDIKTRFIHFGLIGLALVDLSIITKVIMKNSLRGFYEDVLAKGSVLLLNTFIHLFMIFDYFAREESQLSSAFYTDDGVGYGFLLTIGSVIPSIFAVQNVFLTNHNKSIHLPHYCSAAILALFAAGYYLYLTSSELKHRFRRNPFSPSTSDVKSIPTSKKKRLITSGAWGIIRHPNYLGFIIMILASSLTCGFTHPLAYTPLAIITVMLVTRSLRIDSLCQEKYGPAWINYTQKTKKRLIPYVF